MAWLAHSYKRISDLAWRIVPMALIVAVSSYFLGKQIVTPQQRLVKLSLLFLIFVTMLRFDMVFSLYVFILLMPFPSGVVMGSTNLVVVLVIALLWAVRANSAKLSLIKRTELDPYIIFFLLAYVLALLNVEENLRHHLVIVWRQVSAILLFYLTVRFVDNEKKLDTMTKLMALSSALVALTGVIQLISPGAAIIPGWISAGNEALSLRDRVTGRRVGGAVQSHSLLSDYAVMGMFFIAFHFLRSRNPASKVAWLGLLTLSFTAMLATANRGAFVTLIFGVGYALYVFRRYMNLTRYVVTISAIVALFIAGEFILRNYTYVPSATERVLDTKFTKGVIPNNREGAWLPALQRSTEHIFIGHGPRYELGRGLNRRAWPHNAYLYTLYTIGLLGLVAFLLVRFRVFLMTLRYNRPGVSNTLAGKLLAVMHVQLVVHLIAILRTDFQRNSDFIYIFIAWTLFGLIAAAWRLVEEQVGEPRLGDAIETQRAGHNVLRTG